MSVNIECVFDDFIKENISIGTCNKNIDIDTFTGIEDCLLFKIETSKATVIGNSEKYLNYIYTFTDNDLEIFLRTKKTKELKNGYEFEKTTLFFNKLNSSFNSIKSYNRIKEMISFISKIDDYLSKYISVYFDGTNFIIVINKKISENLLLNINNYFSDAYTVSEIRNNKCNKNNNYYYLKLEGETVE